MNKTDPARHSSAAAPADSFAPWAITMWFTAAALWYVWTAARAVAHPLNHGADLAWAGLWLLFSAAVVVSRMVLGPAVEAFFWRPALVAAALVMAFASGRGAAVLITLWLLALAWALGDWLVGRMTAESSPGGPERAAVAVGLGLTLLAFLALTLALIAKLTAAWAWGTLAALTLLRGRFLGSALVRFVRDRRRWLPSTRTEAPPERGPLFVLLGFVALVNFAWALAPEIQYDATNYQLSVPAVYAAEHRLVDLPVFWHSYFAHMVNMLFALAFALDAAAVAKLLVFATGILAAAATHALGRSLWNERVGLWAAALFYTTPLAGWLSGTAYVDLPVTFFFLASLLALLLWREHRHAGWLRASGLLAGAALGTKLPALSSVAALLSALAVLVVTDAALPPRKKIAAVAIYLFALGLVAAPWYAIVLAFTGNPFFPLFNGIFRSPGWDLVNTRLNAGLFGIGTSPGALLELPFALTFRTVRFGEALPDGAAGVALALVPAAVAFGWKAFSGRRFLLVMTACYFLLWAFNVQYARYFVPLLPVVCVVAMAAVFSLSTPGRQSRGANLALAGLVVAAQVPLHFPQYWNIPERVPVRFALGRETDDAFLSRALGGVHAAVRHLNAAVRPGEKVLTGGADALRLYLKAPLASMSETFELKKICGALPPAKVARNLVNNGYTWLLVKGAIDPARPDPFSTPEFLRRFATLELQNAGGSVYRIHPEPNAGSAASNLLSNSGFESLDAQGRPAAWAPHGRPAVLRGSSRAHAGDAAIVSDAENFVSQPVAVDEGSRYVLRHWSREALPGSSARLQVNWLDGSGRLLDASIAVVPASREWTANEMLVTAPAGTATAVIFASVHERGRVVFDDFSFVPAGP